MRTRGLIMLIAFVLLLPVTSSAQVGSLLKNKMNRVVKAGVKTLDKETDAAIDTAVSKEAKKAHAKADERAEQKRLEKNQPSDSTVSESSTESESGSESVSESESVNQSGPPQGGGVIGSMFSNKVELKYKEDYSFSSRIYMVTENYDKSEVMKMDMYMYYSADYPSMGIETKTIADSTGESIPMTITMVMDGENKCFLALTDMNGMKMGTISAVPDENAEPADKKGKKDNPPVYTKTGNTRDIAGYKCDEYTYIDPDDKSNGKVWFTKDARLKVDKRGWKNTGMSAYYGSPEFNDGIILANEAYDNKGKMTMKSETIEINENFPHSITIKGASLRQVNWGQGEKK